MEDVLKRFHVVDLYDYHVTYSPKDDAFVARVTEWPSLAAHGPTVEDALAEVRTVVCACIEGMTEQEEFPEPNNHWFRNAGSAMRLALMNGKYST